jgi:hypothetical protein
MSRDPLLALQGIICDYLQARNKKEKVELDGKIAKVVPWRPHLLEKGICRGWYIHSVPPSSDSWADRAKKATEISHKLRVGVAVVDDLLLDEHFIDLCHALDTAIIIFEPTRDSFTPIAFYECVDDLIYQRQLILSSKCAASILDRGLQRAIVEPDSVRKGVLLELLVAVLLSQVEGFKVTDVGISNRTQQMDVMINNKNVGGALSGSPIVLAEAKNWKNPVGTNEYASFIRKIQSRHGRSRLGYLVTTGRFTAGVPSERRRDSMNETLVVLLDGKSLPMLWRNQSSISGNIERATMEALIGT